MGNIFELTEQLENCTHAKVNFVIDAEHVNADLGCYETVNEEVVFVEKYTSAVVHKSNLIGYVEN